MKVIILATGSEEKKSFCYLYWFSFKNYPQIIYIKIINKTLNKII